MYLDELAPDTQATVSILCDTLITTWLLLDNNHYCLNLDEFKLVTTHLALGRSLGMIYLELLPSELKLYTVGGGDYYFPYASLDVGEVVSCLLSLLNYLKLREENS